MPNKNTPQRLPKQAGGPATAAGKVKASKNALVHGATSPRLLDEAERASYAALLKALKAQYPSSNPLIQMQLERITRLKIQLDRVQNVMDAAFVQERLSKPEFDRAAEALKLNEVEQSQMADWVLGVMAGERRESFVDKALFAVCIELVEIDNFALLSTYEELERYLPGFCRYIVDQATAQKMSLGEYLESRQLDPRLVEFPAQEPKLPSMQNLVLRCLIDMGEALPPPVELRSVEVQTLQFAAAWFRRQTWDLARKAMMIREMYPLMEAAQAASMPNPEKLDRLMRYQTAINRQLSSAMGELLELVKQG